MGQKVDAVTISIYIQKKEKKKKSKKKLSFQILSVFNDLPKQRSVAQN